MQTMQFDLHGPRMVYMESLGQFLRAACSLEDIQGLDGPETTLAKACQARATQGRVSTDGLLAQTMN
jgi:hypothetical protein